MGNYWRSILTVRDDPADWIVFSSLYFFVLFCFFISFLYKRLWRYKSGKTNSSTWSCVCVCARAVRLKREKGGGWMEVLCLLVAHNHRTAPKFGDCSNPSTVYPRRFYLYLSILLLERERERNKGPCREEEESDDRSAQATTTTTSLYFSVTSSATSRFFLCVSPLILICPTGFSLSLDYPLGWHENLFSFFFPLAYVGEAAAAAAAVGSWRWYRSARLYLASSLHHI